MDEPGERRLGRTERVAAILRRKCEAVLRFLACVEELS